mgnify:CR=1 FL=1
MALKKHYKLKDEIFKDKQKKDLKSLTFRKTINELEDKTKTLESLVNIRTNELKGALESEKIIAFFSRELNDTLTLSDALWKIAARRYQSKAGGTVLSTMRSCAMGRL